MEVGIVQRCEGQKGKKINVEDLNSIKHPMEMLVLRRTQMRKEADDLISALGFLFLYFLYIFR